MRSRQFYERFPAAVSSYQRHSFMPYQTYNEFMENTKDGFRPILNRFGHVRKSANDIAIFSWILYNRTGRSESQESAFLYNCEDHDNLLQLESKDYLLIGNKQESLADTGRVYTPEDGHTWPTNATWILAQVHKSRGFITISEANPLQATFPKELYCLYRAGYEMRGLTFNYNKCSLAYFAPPPKEQARKITLFDFLNTTPRACYNTVIHYNKERKELLKQLQINHEPIYACAHSQNGAIVSVVKPRKITNPSILFFKPDEVCEAKAEETISILPSLKT